MDEQQQHTLRTYLLDTGLSEQMVYDIMLLLRYKPERVQLAFYYVSMGHSYRDVADKIGVTFQQVSLYIRDNCEDIRKHLYSVK